MEQMGRSFNLLLRQPLIYIHGHLIRIHELLIMLGVARHGGRHGKRGKLHAVERNHKNQNRSTDNVEKDKQGQPVTNLLERSYLLGGTSSINIKRNFLTPCIAATLNPC